MQWSLKNILLGVLVVMMAVAAHTRVIEAGNLEPTAPPGPTMKTLDQVEPKIPITSLPYTVSTSGSYYLTENLTSTADGISVNADNVTINLMGYSISGGTGRGISMIGCSNVEIRNGTIRDFATSGISEADDHGRGHRVINVRTVSAGIHLTGNNHLVEDCTIKNAAIVTGSGSKVIGNIVCESGYTGIDAGDGSTVANNTVYNTGGNGIEAGNGSTVTKNTVDNNHHDGIRAGSGSTVTGNTVYQNQRDGIVASFSTLTGNTVYQNQRDGMVIGGASVIMYNTVTENNQSDTANCAGIKTFDNSLIKSNIVFSNNQNNIIVAGSDNAIEENLVTWSTNGINFLASGNFYANNRASGNTSNYVGSLPTGSGDGGGNSSF